MPPAAPHTGRSPGLRGGTSSEIPFGQRNKTPLGQSSNKIPLVQHHPEHLNPPALAVLCFFWWLCTLVRLFWWFAFFFFGLVFSFFLFLMCQEDIVRVHSARLTIENEAQTKANKTSPSFVHLLRANHQQKYPLTKKHSCYNRVENHEIP